MSQCYCLQPTVSNRCDVNVDQWINPLPPKLAIDESKQLAEVGYTCGMLFMLATVMTVVLVRAMRLGNNEESEVDLVLEQMRHRDFDERCERDKQRLRKAKRKVVKWMNKRKEKQNNKHEGPFGNLPILLPSFVSLATVAKNESATIDCPPEIVVTDSMERPEQWARRPTQQGEGPLTSRKNPQKEKFQWDSIDSSTTFDPNSPGTASMQFDFNFSETSDGEDSSDDNVSSASNDFLIVPRWRYGSTASECASLSEGTTVSHSGQLVRRSSFSCPRFPTTSEDEDGSSDDTTIKYRSPDPSNRLLSTDLIHSPQFL